MPTGRLPRITGQPSLQDARGGDSLVRMPQFATRSVMLFAVPPLLAGVVGGSRPRRCRCPDLGLQTHGIGRQWRTHGRGRHVLQERHDQAVERQNPFTPSLDEAQPKGRLK